MKSLLPFVIVAVMAGLTSWGMSQGIRCSSGRFAFFQHENRIPAAQTQQRPLVPVFHYPPGVARTVSNMPLPTRNPMFDVDVSSPRGNIPSFTTPSSPFPAPPLASVPNLTVMGKVGGGTQISVQNPGCLLALTPPVQSATLRFQPIPTFTVAAQGVVAGQFDSVSRKSALPFITPHIVIQEYEEEPRVVAPTQPATDVPPPIVGPQPQAEPSETTSVIDPFDNLFGEEAEEDVSVIVPIPDAMEDEATEEPDPFGSLLGEEAGNAPPIVVEVPDVTEEYDPFDIPFGEIAEEDVPFDTPMLDMTEDDATEEGTENSDPFGGDFSFDEDNPFL